MSRFSRVLLLAALITTVSMATVSNPAGAQPAPAEPVMAGPLYAPNSVNVSPLGLAFGSYSVNFERLVTPHHGLLVEGQFSTSSDDNNKSTSGGAALGWRLHFNGTQRSWFVGVMGAYNVGSAEATVTDNAGTRAIDVSTTALSVTANFGKRWVFGPGINITFRFGLGWGRYNVTTESTDPSAKEAVEAVDALLAFFPIGIDGELSIGFCF